MYNDMNGFSPDQFGMGMEGGMDPMGGMGYDPYAAEMAMVNYRGPKENYFFTMDADMLLKLGFTSEELTILQNAVDYYGMVSTQKLSTPPFLVANQTIIARIMYAYNICMGKKLIDTDDPVSLSKHFKRLNQISGGQSTFSAFYIKHRNIDRIPRVAVVANLPQGNFAVLNSRNYDKMEATYKVEKIAKEWVTIYSERKMQVGQADRLNNSYTNREWGIPDILKVEEIGSFAESRPWKLRIHKSHCRLCNRFMIMISTKKMVPGITEHHGGYCLVLGDGQIVYVYARTTDFESYGNPKDSVPATTKDTTVFDYGFYGIEIEHKLKRALEAVAKQWPVVYSKRLDDEVPYREIPEYTGMELIRGVVEEGDMPEEEFDDFD